MRAALRRRGKVAAVLVALALLALAGIPAPAVTAAVPSPGRASDPPAATYNLRITATGTYGYQPDTIGNLPLGTMINLTFVDSTSLPHSFNISSREGVEIVDYTDTTAGELNETLFSAPALYAAYVSGPGEKSVGSFQSPATPGWYEFVCNVSGHFQMGMFGYIAFGEGLPSNLTLPPRTGVGSSTGFPVAEAIVVLVTILVALVVIMMRLRRIVRERALEESDKESPVLPPSPPAP